MYCNNTVSSDAKLITSIINKDLAGVGHSGKGTSTDGEINFRSCQLLQQKIRLVFNVQLILCPTKNYH